MNQDGVEGLNRTLFLRHREVEPAHVTDSDANLQKIDIRSAALPDALGVTHQIKQSRRCGIHQAELGAGVMGAIPQI